MIDDLKKYIDDHPLINKILRINFHKFSNEDDKTILIHS